MTNKTTVKLSPPAVEEELRSDIKTIIYLSEPCFGEKGKK